MSIELAVSLLWLITALQGFLLIVLYRQVGLKLLNKAEAIAKDGPAIDSKVSKKLALPLSELIPAKIPFRLVVFARPGCAACKGLWPQLIQFVSLREAITPLVVLGGDESAARAYQAEHSLPFPVLADPNDRVFDACIVRVSPFAIVVNSHGVVLSKGLVNHSEHLSLLTRALPELGTNQESVNLERSDDAVKLA